MPQASETINRMWTFMVYLAGDNNLQDYGVKDLREMKKVGSSPEVAIIAQFDAMSDNVTRRYELTQSRMLSDDLVGTLPEINTGDPQNLLEFVQWAVNAYPAEKYALVLWNHGSGWKEDSIYQAAERLGTTASLASNVTRSLTTRRTSRSLFRSSLEWFVADPRRAIAYDDSSSDFLDNTELKNVLTMISQLIGKPIDLLGFDACLMNMIEVAYQLRAQAEVIVGSQELEPGEGWPYHLVLSRLAANPTMTARELARLIVDEYIDFFRKPIPILDVTQSAIEARYVDSTASLVDALSRSILALSGQTSRQSLIFFALRQAQKFKDPDYFDLLDLSRALKDANRSTRINQTADDLIQHLRSNQSPILASLTSGDSVKNANGLSIYLPVRTLSPLYKNLDFVKRTSWGDLLHSISS